MRSSYKLHEFTLGDVEDVEIYAAQPIYEWQQTPEGKWCMEHAEDVHWHSYIDPGKYGWTIRIFGTLEDKYATFWSLKRT